MIVSHDINFNDINFNGINFNGIHCALIVSIGFA